MNQRAVLLGLSLCLVASPVLAQDNVMKQAQGLFKPIPMQPPTMEGNPITPPKVELGKMLYFDPRLSESHTISCNSCHIVGLGGVDVAETSLGHRWQRGPRNSPTVLNAVFNTAQFWDGRAKDLKEQAGGPLVNPIEMATTETHTIEMLTAIPGYAEPFKHAFPKESDPISFENVKKAIAAFEAALLTPNAPFDRYLQGDANALTAAQKQGLKLFLEKGCAGCHNGINLGGQRYAPVGVVETAAARVRPTGDTRGAEVTKRAGDGDVFKVPTLRNIGLAPPYFRAG